MKAFVKQPTEKYDVTVDFSDVLGTETISSLDAKAYDKSGADVSSTIISTSTNDTTSATVKVQAGTAGTKYRIVAKVTSNSGDIYEDELVMLVLDE